MSEGFRFACPIRVRYGEVDRQGIVYYSRYLEYVDVAHTEYFRAVGYDYQALVVGHGLDPSVVQATLEYKRPARFDEVLHVHARVAAIGRTSFRMEYEIARAPGEEPIASVQIIYVNFDTATQTSRPIPQSIRQRIELFEGTAYPAPA